MCGIVGRVERAGGRASNSPEGLLGGALEALAHRGPDGRGAVSYGRVALGHTRLAVRHPDAPGAAQPIWTPCGGYALVYNGELYDDEHWRAELGPEVEARTGGAGFATRCDAETLLWALALRGPSALDRVRGMYALAFLDVRAEVLYLARDPLGVKPLFHAASEGDGLAFASEIPALRRVPGVRADAVDPEMMAAYFVTSRRTLFGRTLFNGIHEVEPGQVLRIDVSARASARPVPVATAARFDVVPSASEAQAPTTRQVVEESVRAHLVSDVPLCAMLSGGLDSGAIVDTASRVRSGDLATFCAAGVADGGPLGEDPAAAASFARALGTDHTFVPVEREVFLSEWREHVAHLAQPLSTPNEVAILRTARVIRGSGAVVALSGEGADELFGGYGDVLAAVLDGPGGDAAADRHLAVSSWFPPDRLDRILVGAAPVDFVRDAYRAEFARAAATSGPGGSDLDAHLALQRRVNLASLLERLDAATMRASIEGRTPFADVVVARHAASLAASDRFTEAPDGAHGTKLALRRAFADLPAGAAERPKASFPLPFEAWSEDLASFALGSEFVRTHVEATFLDVVERGGFGAQSWRAWWLLGNLALFGEAAFGVSARRAVA
ncbi:MAG: asparagine synthase (glutamine-hydrolyzing) [Planctomycetota bacterium]